MARLQEATGDDTFTVRYSDAVRAVLTRFPIGLPNGGPVRSGRNSCGQTADLVRHRFWLGRFLLRPRQKAIFCSEFHLHVLKTYNTLAYK